MPSVTKLAISGSKKFKGKLSARPKGTGTSEIPGTLSDIIAKVTAANKTKRKGLVIAG
jgi:hypothetical protein